MLQPATNTAPSATSATARVNLAHTLTLKDYQRLNREGRTNQKAELRSQKSEGRGDYKKIRSLEDEKI